MEGFLGEVTLKKVEGRRLMGTDLNKRDYCRNYCTGSRSLCCADCMQGRMSQLR